MQEVKLPVMAWRNLWRNRRRTVLTLSSIVFGVFLAVIFTAFQDQNWTDMINLAARMGGGHVTIQHPEYRDTPTLSRSVENTDALMRIAQRQENVTRVVQRISGHTMLMSAGESFGAGFIAFDPGAEDESSFSVLEALVDGEMFETSHDRGIILGDKLAQNLRVELGDRVVFTLTDKTGEIVSGLSRLTGTVHTGASSVDAGLALLPIDSVRSVLSYRPDEAIQLAVFLSDQRRSVAVAGRLADEMDDTVAILPWFEIQPELSGFIAMKVGGARFMEGLIAVLVAAGIFNTLFVSVMERMREFGILMAIGFSPGRLFRLVMLESLWLGIVGLVGAAVVTIGPYLYLSSTGIDLSGMIGEDSTEIAGVAMAPKFSVGIYPESLVVIATAALIATLLSGLYPAWRAGRVEPVKSIKLA